MGPPPGSIAAFDMHEWPCMSGHASELPTAMLFPRPVKYALVLFCSSDRHTASPSAKIAACIPATLHELQLEAPLRHRSSNQDLLGETRRLPVCAWSKIGVDCGSASHPHRSAEPTQCGGGGVKGEGAVTHSDCLHVHFQQRQLNSSSSTTRAFKAQVYARLTAVPHAASRRRELQRRPARTSAGGQDCFSALGRGPDKLHRFCTPELSVISSHTLIEDAARSPPAV